MDSQIVGLSSGSGKREGIVSEKEKAELIAAATATDWGQVITNGGPPCFYFDGPNFCLRARRWAGHNRESLDHKFVPLDELLSLAVAE